MKLRALFTTLALGAAVSLTTPAQAQGGDPCSVYTCMAGISGFGLSGGPACTPDYLTFFLIQIWDPYYDAVSTSTARREYLMSCPGANVATNEGVLADIISIWGEVP